MASSSPTKLTSTDLAQRAIKDFILAERLKPGDALPTEATFAERIGVSRSSLREAIRTLSALDVVEVRHGTGTFVGGLSFRPLVEGLAFRSVLEPDDDLTAFREVIDVRISLDVAIAPELVARMHGSEHHELRELVAKMRELQTVGESFADEDRAFHEALLAYSGNSIYSQLAAAFWDIYTVVRPQLGVPTPDDMMDTVDAHDAMIDAVEDGDLDALIAAIRAHYAPLQRVIANRNTSAPDRQ